MLGSGKGPGKKGIKDDIFRDLEIIINPWASMSSQKKIQKTIKNSLLNESIKNSISIKHSELYGLVK